MRILFIPLDTFNLKSNEHVPNRIGLLSGRNEIIGVKRSKPFTEGMAKATAYIKFLLYAAKVCLFALRHYKDFDLIYCFESGYALIGVAISILTGKPCIRDNAGVTREWCHRVKPSMLYTLAALTSEKIVSRFMKMMIVLSEADKHAYIIYGFDPKKIAVIPLPADLSLADKIAEDKEALRERLGLERNKRILIFSGKRDYPPNMEAAEWINQVLALAICQRLNNTQILMTGSGEIPKSVQSIVTFTGFVPDLFEYIHASDVFIAPIEMPSGYLTKVFDSLACSKPTVVMASATNGIPELLDGNNAMVAKDRNEFIEKTIYLLEHPDEAEEIGVRGRKMLEENYSRSIWEERLNEVLEGCLI